MDTQTVLEAWHGFTASTTTPVSGQSRSAGFLPVARRVSMSSRISARWNTRCTTSGEKTVLFNWEVASQSMSYRPTYRSPGTFLTNRSSLFIAVAYRWYGMPGGAVSWRCFWTETVWDSV
jgi:hypothetical protein